MPCEQSSALSILDISLEALNNMLYKRPLPDSLLELSQLSFARDIRIIPIGYNPSNRENSLSPTLGY